MLEDLIKKLELRDQMSPDETGAIEELVSGVDRHKRHDTIVAESTHQTSSRVLLEGWVARMKILRDGRRQISEFHIAGDFVDLHSFTLKRLDHNIVALTD